MYLIKILFVGVAAVAVGLSAGLATANSIYVGPDNGDWNVDSNWNPAHVPVLGDYPVIDSGLTVQITGDIPAAGTWFVGNSGAGTVAQSAGTNSAPNLEVGYVSSGTLNLSGGSLTTAQLVLGRSANGTITQTDGTFTDTGATYMAWSGGSASYNMQGGILNLTTINIGSVANSAFNFSGGDVYLAGNQLTIDQNSWFHVTGDPSLYGKEYLSGTDQTHLFFTPVPEPSALVLSMAGLLGLLAFARRKRK